MKRFLQKQRNRLVACECLERRNLLAGDLVAGDANGDYYFDGADFVHSMKFGLFETGEAATWESGDWNDNGLYNSGDFVSAFVTGKYETGAYDPDATEPVHAAVPFDTEGEAVVTVYYDDSNGTLTAVTPTAFMTTLELRSSSDLFLSSNQRFGLFDRSTTSRWFRLIPNGVPVITLPNALPSGLTLEELQNDLIVDGSLYGGGGLQNVQLDVIDNIPDELPTGQGVNGDPPPVDNPSPTQPPVSETVPAPGRSFVDVNQANVLLSYDSVSGDITVTGLGTNVNALELISQQGIFQLDGGGEEQLFDVTVPHKIFRLRTGSGVNVIELPAVAQTGLSAAQFATDVTFSGVMQDRTTMNMGFVMAKPDTIALGDANADFYFNEADVLTMMKSGAFGNGGTAVWQTGDWTDDFRFDQTDIDLLTQLEYYGTGPYSDLASSSRAERTEISAGNHGDVLLYYDPANGDLSVLASSVKLTALNLVSSNQQFRTQAVHHPLDVSTSQTLFRLSLDPTDTWTFPGLLPPNLAFADVVADVQIDAAFSIGTREFVATLTDSPEIPDFAIGDANRDLYVDEADLIYAFQSGKFGTSESAEWHEGDFDGNGRFDDTDLSLWQESSSYSPEGSSYRPTSFLPQHRRTRLQLSNSDLRIVYLKSTGSTAVLTEHALSALQLHSESGNIVSATETTGPFDVRSPTNYFAFAPDGIDTNRILLQLTPGLSRDALLRDLTVAGALADGASLGPVSLVVIEPVPSELQCREIVAAGAVIGDANLDGRFDSADLIWVFQDGEYEDDIPDNSDWYSGDWNCDGDFDAKDIVAAFQNGGFSFEARADIAMSVISHLADMQQERMQLKPRYFKLPLSNGEWQP